MINNEELAYWYTLAMMPKIWTKRKIEIYAKCNDCIPQIHISQLLEDSTLWNAIGMSEEEISIFNKAKSELQNNSLIVNQLLQDGFGIIPLTSNEYPETMKRNMGTKSPIVLFTKGDIRLLQKTSVAVVGSRNASNVSIEFADSVVRKQVNYGKTIVSGGAKGIDKQALNSAIKYGGESIIVIPQGITTFTAGYKEYSKLIDQGKILVVSCFHPNAPWNVEFAMARNSVIYGMAETIYVAQSDSKGGTWSGVIEGLRRKRDIYVRFPSDNENVANIQLIQKGAHAVDKEGGRLELPRELLMTEEEKEKEETDERIRFLLKNGKLTTQAIKSALKLTWSDEKMKTYLLKLPFIKKEKIKNRIYFSLSDSKEQTLF